MQVLSVMYELKDFTLTDGGNGFASHQQEGHAVNAR